MVNMGRANVRTLMPLVALAAASVLHLAAPRRGHAQARPEGTRAVASNVVSLRGVVYDSLRGRPVPRAIVEVADLPHTTVSDDEGRFRLDSLPAGKLRLTFSAPSLDSLGLFAFVNDVETGSARTNGNVQLATPSFHTMYTRLCAPTDTPPRDSAIVFGAVRDATSKAAVGAARVSFRWAAASTNDVRLEAVREARSAADGTYGVCGLPASQSLSAQASTDAAASAVTELRVGDVRITRVDLTVSNEMPLPQSPSAQPPEISGASKAMGPDQAAFRARKALGNGIFLEQDAFRTHNEMGQVLLRVRGIGVERINAKYHYTASGRTCAPGLIIDGEPRLSIDDDLQNLSPRNVIALEYHSLTSKVLPPELLQGVTGCGDVLVLWTKRARW